METLEIKKPNAISAYNSADDKGKKLLEDLLGKQVFQKITDRVKTYKDACEVTGDKYIDLSAITNDDEYDVAVYRIVRTIVKALNEGWVPNLFDTSEKKYYPWFSVSGSALSYDGYYYDNSCSAVGSRLCFKTSDLAKYAGTQFLTEFTNYHKATR